MEAKEYLEQIIRLRQLIGKLDVKIARKRYCLQSFGSSGFGVGRPQNNSNDSRHARILVEIDSLEYQKRQVDSLISTFSQELEDVFDRMEETSAAVLTGRYICGQSLRQIAGSVYLSKTTVCRKIEAAVDQVQVPEPHFELNQELKNAHLTSLIEMC